MYVAFEKVHMHASDSGDCIIVYFVRRCGSVAGVSSMAVMFPECCQLYRTGLDATHPGMNAADSSR